MIVVNMNAPISTLLLGDNSFAFLMIDMRNNANAAPETKITAIGLLEDGRCNHYWFQSKMAIEIHLGFVYE